MAKYKQSFVSGSDKTRFGAVLVNLGTPKSPTRSSVRKFLRQFLSDSRVVELPKPLWWPILNGIILVIRPKKSAAAYQKIWLKEGSPLMVYSLKQSEKLERHLNDIGVDNALVRSAMSYGEPSIKQVLLEFERIGIQKMFILPMYPQYSGSTTGSVFDAVGSAMRWRRFVPSIRFMNGYAEEPKYIDALKNSILNHWQTNGKSQKLVISFHGLPKDICEKGGDPYYDQCMATAKQLSQKLELSHGEWTVCFQSRFGPKKWLEPYMDSVISSLPDQGYKTIDVICPGFSVDCLETLEEVNIGYRELFLECGGESFNYIPCLNDRRHSIEMLAHFVQKSAWDWIEN